MGHNEGALRQMPAGQAEVRRVRCFLTSMFGVVAINWHHNCPQCPPHLPNVLYNLSSPWTTLGSWAGRGKKSMYTEDGGGEED